MQRHKILLNHQFFISRTMTKSDTEAGRATENDIERKKLAKNDRATDGKITIRISLKIMLIRLCIINTAIVTTRIIAAMLPPAPKSSDIMSFKAVNPSGI